MTLYLLAGVLLACAAWTDHQRRVIPDQLVFLLLCCGAGRVAMTSYTLLAALAGLLLWGGGTLIFALAGADNRLGGGDIKLCGVLGFLLGPLGAYPVILFSLAVLVIVGKAGRFKSLPLAPFSFLAYIFLLAFLF